VHARVSADACTENSPGATATTVRQAPEQAIDAPVGIAEVSNAVAIVKSTRSPRRSRFTLPRSVMMPVNMPVGYGSTTRFARVSPRGQECERAMVVGGRGAGEFLVEAVAPQAILLISLLACIVPAGARAADEIKAGDGSPRRLSGDPSFFRSAIFTISGDPRGAVDSSAPLAIAPRCARDRERRTIFYLQSRCLLCAETSRSPVMGRTSQTDPFRTFGLTPAAVRDQPAIC
jgi:hypothetical protein